MTTIAVLGEWSNNNWLGNDRYRGYVKLAPNVDPNDLKDAIRKMQEAHQPLEELERDGSKIWYTLTPFATFHRHNQSVKNAMRIGLSPLYFLVGALFVILIVTIVVVLSSNRMARMNPVKSLKNN